MAGRARNTPSVVDTEDVTPRQPVEAAVKRVKATPFSGGTTVIVRSIDFEKAGNIDHPDVTWDYRINGFTVEVDKEITAEAADFLVNNYPGSFQFIGG